MTSDWKGKCIPEVMCDSHTFQVYRVPEMATILLPGGVNFAELTAEAAEKFQVGKIDKHHTIMICPPRAPLYESEKENPFWPRQRCENTIPHFISLQENLLVSMMQVENTFFDLAEACTDRNVLVICDRGTMDASAFINRDQWNNIISRTGLDEVEIRDNRYNQVGNSSLLANYNNDHPQYGVSRII